MAWTAGEDVSTGQLITAARWNNYLGSGSSLEYLKTEVDRIDDCAQNDVTGSRNITGTIYQNTTDGPKAVVITVECTDDGVDKITGYCDAGASPTTEIGSAGYHIVVSPAYADARFCLPFVVAPNYYYKVLSTNNPVLKKWFEWDLH